MLSPRLSAPPPSCETPGRLWYEKTTPASRFALGVDSAAIIAPGDILNVNGAGNGIGSFGHALLVTGMPEVTSESSELRERLAEHWPAKARSLLKVPVVESCRASAGLHRTALLLHHHSGRFDLIGEIDDEDELHYYYSEETVDVWQSPAPLRSRFCQRTMRRVLARMAAREADWSYATAVRAFLRPAALELDADDADVVSQARASWTVAPICTSVPIVFWQRYLCRMAGSSGASEATFIRRWMPVSADRTLPEELSAALRRCGWQCQRAD